MKRSTRRILAVALGLALGWSAAGLLPTLFPDSSVSLAADESHEAVAPTPAGAGGDKPVTPAPGPGSSGGAERMAASTSSEAPSAAAGMEHEHAARERPAGAEEGDAGTRAAAQLVPREGDVDWFHDVLVGVVALFFAAAVIGPIALKLKGPPLPDPAADDHGHDDHDGDGHGHDEHGHGEKGHGDHEAKPAAGGHAAH